MIKLIVVYGVVLAVASMMACAPFVIPSVLESQSSAGQESSAAADELFGKYAQAYSDGLFSTLSRAGSEIKDEKTAFFYGKLVQGYELKTPASESAGSNGLAGLVPDMKKIERQAVTLPLREAGKGIQDQEIADFYFDFLRRCGLDN